MKQLEKRLSSLRASEKLLTATAADPFDSRSPFSGGNSDFNSSSSRQSGAGSEGHSRGSSSSTSSTKAYRADGKQQSSTYRDNRVTASSEAEFRKREIIEEELLKLKKKIKKP